MRLRIGVAVTLFMLTASHAAAQTSVTRASAQTIQLVPGGTAVPVTLDGTNLHSVTTARVHLSGRTVTGLTAVLNRSARPSRVDMVRLVINLNAASTVAPGTYHVELMAGTQRVLVPVSVTVVPSAGANLPIPLQPPALPGVPAPTPVGVMEVVTPSVTSATPTTVSLRPGGDPVTVVLNGALLNQINSARLERNGSLAHSFRAELLPASGSARREVRLSAPASAPTDLVLDLVLMGRIGSSPVLMEVPTPVRVEVSLPVVRISSNDLFATPINGVLARSVTHFNSCGGTAAERRFQVNLPGAGYNSTGDVPRHESGVSVPDGVAFLEAHSLTPNDIFRPDQLGSLTRTAHPSPLPHTVNSLRMCLLNLRTTGGWTFTSADEGTSGAPTLTITVTHQRVLFRGRGMPAGPGGAPDLLNIGLGWGHQITDDEIPDYIYTRPEYQVRIPLTITDGVVRYESVTVTLRAPNAQWSDTFFGPVSARTRLEQYANTRMQQIAQEIRKAFNSANMKNAISGSINSLLSQRGVTEVVGMRPLSADTWGVTHR